MRLALDTKGWRYEQKRLGPFLVINFAELCLRSPRGREHELVAVLLEPTVPILKAQRILAILGRKRMTSHLRVRMPHIQMPQRPRLLDQIKPFRVLQNLVRAHAGADPPHQQIRLVLILLFQFGVESRLPGIYCQVFQMLIIDLFPITSIQISLK